MKNTASKILLLVFIILLNAGCDQYTKKIAQENLENIPGSSYLGDTFRLIYSENTGAFLSLGASLEGGARTIALNVLPLFLLIGMTFYTLLSKELPFVQRIAFAFILGGGISNIYDRLMYGHVVDFLNMGIGSLRTGIFNLADVSIMFGVGLFLVASFWGGKSD